ncbi:hypothetical protein AB7M47_002149 [Bradyrhizobium elkanii]
MPLPVGEGAKLRSMMTPSHIRGSLRKYGEVRPLYQLVEKRKRASAVTILIGLGDQDRAVFRRKEAHCGATPPQTSLPNSFAQSGPKLIRRSAISNSAEM